ncbi:MAG TPA: hypothetical protein VGO13_00220 [Solirubrobacterales bacterium]|nr:hypothetical protein [Solirubrobacterales bacterium]
MSLEALLGVKDGGIKAALLCRNGKHNEAITQTGVNRPNGRVALFGAQLKEVGLALQRLDVRAGKVGAERSQLVDDVEERLAFASGLDVLEVDNRIAVEDDAAEIRARNEAEGGPPPGLPAKKLLILSGEGGKSLAITFFETEEDYRQGDETLNSMSPPSGDNDMGQRAGVEKFEVVLEMEP